MNIQALAREFWEKGYLLIGDFFPQDLMDQLNQISLEHFSLNPAWGHDEEFLKKSATEVIPWFPIREGNREFLPLIENADLNCLTEAILGSKWKSLYCMLMFSKKGSKGQAWHQDCPPENPQTFNLNRLIYTHDITEEIGGQTLLMPHSHKKGAISVGKPHEDLDGQLVLSPEKGSLLLLHGHAWHRVLAVKGAYRLSINCRAIPSGTSEDITDIAVYRNMRYRFSTHEIIEERTKS